MLGWLTILTALAAGPDGTPIERLEACGDTPVAAAWPDLSDKDRRKRTYDAARAHLEGERYVCAADLLHLVRNTGTPKKADLRRLDELLVIALDLAYDGPAREALFACRFDEAEALYRRLALMGHRTSIETVRSFARLDRRRWRLDRAKEAMAERRPRYARTLLKPAIEGADRRVSNLPMEEVEATYAEIEAAVAADEALAEKERAEGVTCWSTLTGQPPDVEVVGGCDEGVSELLRERHASRVALRRDKPREGPEHLTTSHKR